MFYIVMCHTLCFHKLLFTKKYWHAFLFLSYITLYFITHKLCKNVYFSLVLTYFVFFSPDLSRNDAIILSSNSNKRVVYINENDNMCEKLSPVLVFLYVLIYDTIYVSHHVVLISLVLSFYILNLCKKDVITYALRKLCI